jgi:hypothetical protein
MKDWFLVPRDPSNSILSVKPGKQGAAVLSPSGWQQIMDQVLKKTPFKNDPRGGLNIK